MGEAHQLYEYTKTNVTHVTSATRSWRPEPTTFYCETSAFLLAMWLRQGLH